jgi:hypothetical protein
VFEKEDTRIVWGLIVRCDRCNKKNYIHIATQEQAWKQIIGDHPFPEGRDSEADK